MTKTTTTILVLLALVTSALVAPAEAQRRRGRNEAERADTDAENTEVVEKEPMVERDRQGPEVVALPSTDSPLVAIRLLFKVGSMHDPKGKEGLASLTGLMLSQSGTAHRSYAEAVDKLYPMAASINVTTDREVTVISGEVHRETLDEYLGLLLEGLLEPGFKEEDLTRHKAQLNAYLTNTLRASNDELLGLEALQQLIFADHPYGHAPQGTVEGLAGITLDDVRTFYSTFYYPSNLMLGLAGGFSEGLAEELTTKLAALPEGGMADGRVDHDLPSPRAIDAEGDAETDVSDSGRRFVLIDKPTDSVGIHFGYALPINRSHADYYPLMVANSFLGEHRTFHGRLMKQLRGKRGLNYGDYSYIEYWHFPPFTSNPGPNVPRRQQYFSVWIRPVVPNTAHFALRNALYEVDRLIDMGMTQDEFELTRDFVVNYSKLWAQSPANRLGFEMDSLYYRMDSYIGQIDERLKELTLEEVNDAIRRHLRTNNFHAVFVTANAEQVKSYLEEDKPSPMNYNARPEDEVMRADKTIEKIEVRPQSIEIVSVQDMFQGEGK
ncbi:MAG: M16 family metallopeptidase [Thermoanaerobaculia bacterium]